MGVDGGMFLDKIRMYADWWDVVSGMIKASVFGMILAVVGCHKGLNASGGARGVGMATTESVVVSSILILVVDYFLTLLLYR
jgi:phospholipid/cholesterol/gamma-HCH transport system permease protein